MISNPRFSESKNGWMVDAKHGFAMSPKFSIVGPPSIPYYAILHHLFGGEGSSGELISFFLEGQRSSAIWGLFS